MVAWDKVESTERIEKEVFNSVLFLLKNFENHLMSKLNSLKLPTTWLKFLVFSVFSPLSSSRNSPRKIHTVPAKTCAFGISLMSQVRNEKSRTRMIRRYSNNSENKYGGLSKRGYKNIFSCEIRVRRKFPWETKIAKNPLSEPPGKA